MYDVEEVNDNHYYIMIEQELTQETHSFAEAVFLLLAVHYVFNLEYNSAVYDMLIKDQQVKRHSAVYTTITRLYRAGQKKLRGLEAMSNSMED